MNPLTVQTVYSTWKDAPIFTKLNSHTVLKWQKWHVWGWHDELQAKELENFLEDKSAWVLGTVKVSWQWHFDVSCSVTEEIWLIKPEWLIYLQTFVTDHWPSTANTIKWIRQNFSHFPLNHSVFHASAWMITAADVSVWGSFSTPVVCYRRKWMTIIKRNFR